MNTNANNDPAKAVTRHSKLKTQANASFFIFAA